MNLTRIFSILCGMIFGAAMVLLFSHSVRANIAARSKWVAAHPRGYIAVVTLSALIILIVAYTITVRFA